MAEYTAFSFHPCVLVVPESCVRLSLAPQTVAHQFFKFSGKITGGVVISYSTEPSQQESNLHLLRLLHWPVDSLLVAPP